MYKALIKKQLFELVAFLFNDAKKHKRRTIASTVLLIILFGFVGVSFLACFALLGGALCIKLAPTGNGWLFFAIMGVIAVLFAVLGSAFLAYSSLYSAKDNELLLSMPIKPSAILLSRMIGLYVMCFATSALVILPAFVVFFIFGAPNAMSIIAFALMLLILPIFALTICCILGYLISLIAAKLGSRMRTVMTTVLSFAFLAVYFVFYSRSSEFVKQLIDNSDSFGSAMKTWLFPFFLMGKGSAGSILHFLLFTALTVGFFALVYFVLSKTFLRIATSQRGESYKSYSKAAQRSSSIFSSLLRKELAHFTSSPAYMINSALGTVMYIVASVFIVIKAPPLLEMLTPLGIDTGLICAAVAGFIASMNTITAPSISIEGNTLWVLQSSPIAPWQIFKAKLALHFLLTAIPALVFIVCASIAMKASIVSAILAAIFLLAFIAFSACVGLILNLKMPNLDWTNETVAVKQSFSVLFAMLGGMGIIIALVIAYIVLSTFVSSLVFIICASALLIAFAVLAVMWLKGKGERGFAVL